MPTNIFRSLKFGKETFTPKTYNEQSFIMDYALESGGGVPTHLHKHMDEHFLINKGEMTFSIDGKKVVKKAGEEMFVPKGTPHAIKNAGKETAELVVTYSPCSDTHRMFEIIMNLDEANPGSMINMIKYFYLAPRLGLKEFSTPSPQIVMNLINAIVLVMGKLSGWDKLINKFK